MSIMEERYDLAYHRILEIDGKEFGSYEEYVTKEKQFFLTLCDVLTKERDITHLKEWNHLLYKDVEGKNYETSLTNPSYMATKYGEGEGAYLCLYAVTFRDAIVAAYERDLEAVVTSLELFLQLLIILKDSDRERGMKETIYYHIHDYDELRVRKRIETMLLPEKSQAIRDRILHADYSKTDYLYEFGEFITENEQTMAKFLSGLPEKTLSDIAATYTDGFKKGMELAEIDLSKKKTVQIRYHIGFEPIVRHAVMQFEKMGLTPVFTQRTNTQAIGVYSTSPNRQYQYDHRYDDALYMNKALLTHRLQLAKLIFKEYETEASEFAGPAVIDVFGEPFFSPEKKKESPAYTKEQELISREYQRDYALMQNEFIPQSDYSFTIIAFPLPSIGAEFEKIFDATIRVNTLDENRYKEIQQRLIEALDEGEYVHITGRGENQTDLKVRLHELADKKTQTNFENCLADVNIPVGEVFTSPVLKGTTGKLHVSNVFLKGLRYEQLMITFEDGMVTSYTCSNYEEESENKAYIKENVLNDHDTLPMGEFAIGTNTTAYRMGRMFDIEEKLPILIAEKTGPHFAIGDTCYSMSEDVIVKNPDGREVIARDNECSILRKTEPEKAYFNCHTDITIPYDELGDIAAVTKTGERILLLQEGRFVLPGTEALNEMLDEGERVCI